MEQVKVALAWINTESGDQIVIFRKEEGNFGLPGGKVKDSEFPVEAVIRELGEECGLTGFLPEDFEIISVQKRIQDNKEIELHVFGLKFGLYVDVPLFSAETHIEPMIMNPAQFYLRTKFKDFYQNLFPN